MIGHQSGTVRKDKVGPRQPERTVQGLRPRGFLHEVSGRYGRTLYAR